MKLARVLLGLAVATAAASAAPKANPEATARAFVAVLAAGEADGAKTMFDPNIKTITGEQLVGAWRQLVAMHGAFDRCDGAKTGKAMGFDEVLLDCRFGAGGNDHVGVQIVVDPSAHVAGMFFHPQAAWTPPPYSAKDAITRDVTVGAAPFALPGTLTLPAGKGPFPVVVLVHGSGPGDRDETVGANKPFADLALGLAAHGIATIRFDKRTKLYGAKLAGDPSFTVKDESIDDALAAAALARTQRELDPKRVFVLGHSLGGQLVPRIAARDPKLAGGIIMAGSTEPLLGAMRRQLTYLGSQAGAAGAELAKQLAPLDAAIARLAAIRHGAKPEPGEQILELPVGYLLDLDAYDAPATAAKLKLPLDILQGGRDYQVTSASLDAWKHALAGHANVTTKLYPALDHLFLPGTGPSTPAEYEQPNHVDAAVIDDLAAWITKR